MWRAGANNIEAIARQLSKATYNLNFASLPLPPVSSPHLLCYRRCRWALTDTWLGLKLEPGRGQWLQRWILRDNVWALAAVVWKVIEVVRRVAWEVELLGTGGTHRPSFCPNPIHSFCLGHGRQQILSPSVLSSLTDKCWVTSSYLWSSHILSSRQLYRPLWMLWVSPTLSFYLCMPTISQALSSPVLVSPEWARLGKLVHLISKQTPTTRSFQYNWRRSCRSQLWKARRGEELYNNTIKCYNQV